MKFVNNKLVYFVSEYISTCIKANNQADRQKGRQAGRQTDRQTDRQTGRETDRQTLAVIISENKVETADRNQEKEALRMFFLLF